MHIAHCEKIPEHIIDLGIDWCQKPHRLLIPGCVKTHFTCCLVRQAIRRFGLHQIRWTKSKALDDRILEAFNQYGDTPLPLCQYCDVGILFIDDFGDQAKEPNATTTS